MLRPAVIEMDANDAERVALEKQIDLGQSVVCQGDGPRV